MFQDKRLVTGGCSFTQYCWPTWADYLGKHYRQHIQAGMCGIDNATVARRIIEQAQPGDHVVIQWSGMDRWSGYENDRWLYTGCVVSNRAFFANHYHRLERFTTSMDYVKLIDCHAQAVGYQVHHFTAYPWFQGEVEKKIHPELVELFSKYAVPNFHIDDDLESFRTRKGTLMTKHKYNQEDNHPTPKHHWDWLVEHIAPKLEINIDQNLENSVQLDQQRVLKGDVD